MEEVIKIHFRSVKDFRNRICALWQDQKENEVYEFSFESEEVENEYNDLVERFQIRR